MAALDLHRGVDSGVCVWSGECVELLDSFDSEIEQWEEQLQEVQRKIEELYKVVESRRGANESSSNPNTHLDIALLAVDKAIGCPATGYHDGKANFGFNYSGIPLNKAPNYDHNGFLCSESYGLNGGQDVTLEILDGYLGLKSDLSQHKPREDPNTKSTGDQRSFSYQDRRNQWPVIGWTGVGSQPGFEEAQNRKNKDSPLVEPRVRHVSWKSPISSPEKSVNKQPVKQRDALVRTAHFPESPLLPDRKCLLVDRKCASPSVLRKFDAMLQENEGKMLVEDGTVTTLVPSMGSKYPKIGGNQRPKRLTVHKCAKDSEVPLTLQNAEHRGMKAGIQTTRWGVQGAEMQSEHKMVERTVGNFVASQYQVKSVTHHRNTPTPQQMSRESSPVPTRRSFSRPARPANQRPPSRWASHTPSEKIATPSGPRSRSLSPDCRTQQRFTNFRSYTETVIM